MDSFFGLKKDHRVVSGIIRMIKLTTNRAKKTRGMLFKRLRRDIEIHTQLEERVLYPALKNRDETHDLITESIEEHQTMKQMLENLAGTSNTSDMWLDHLKALEHEIDHHVREEEGSLFKLAQEVLPEEELRSLKQRLHDAKKELRHSYTPA